MQDRQPVSGWSRVHVEASCHVISAASLVPIVACATCGAPLRPRLGVWLGADEPGSTGDVARDELGYDHLDFRRPIVVPVDRARFLAREFQTGIDVEPVFAPDSAIGRQVHGFLRVVASLRAAGAGAP